MRECYNNFVFPSHSFIYTAILNIHCFFPLEYVYEVHYLINFNPAIRTLFTSKLSNGWSLLGSRANMFVTRGCEKCMPFQNLKKAQQGVVQGTIFPPIWIQIGKQFQPL